VTDGEIHATEVVDDEPRFEAGEFHRLDLAVSADWTETARTVALSLAGKIPEVGGAVVYLLGQFWPSNAPTIWAQIQSQVNATVNAAILTAEIARDQASFSGLLTTMNRYVSSSPPEAGAELVAALGKADDLYAALTQSSNADQLIPLTVALSQVHLTLLSERNQHGTVQFNQAYDPRWATALSAQREEYRQYFRAIYPQWHAWRESQVTASWGTTRGNVAYGDAIDELVPGSALHFEEGMNTNHDYYKVSALAVRERLLNRAIANMAATFAPTFLLNLYDPATWDQPPDVDPQLANLVLGPYSAASMGQNPTPSSSSTNLKDTDGFVSAINLRALNSIDGFQLRYVGRDGIYSGSSTSERAAQNYIVGLGEGGHFTGLDVRFNNQLMYWVAIHRADGSVDGPYGNAGNWRGAQDSAVVDPSYALVGAEYAWGSGPSGTVGTASLRLHFAYESLMQPAPPDFTLLRQASDPIWVIFGGARFHVPDPPTIMRLYPGLPQDQVPDDVVQNLPEIPRDGTLLHQESGPVSVIFGAARFRVPDPQTLARLYDVNAVRPVWDGALVGIGSIPQDGTLLREESDPIWVIFGGARFHIPDPQTLLRLYDPSKERQVWDGALVGIGSIPEDGTLLREESGPIWVIFGGARFHIPDPGTLMRLYDPSTECQLWDGALNGISSMPQDGTLLREESGTIWVIFGGARFHVPDPQTLTALYDPNAVRQLWDGATDGIGSTPSDGTLLRETSSTQVWVIRGGHKAPAPAPVTGRIGVLWDGALAQFPPSAE